MAIFALLLQELDVLLLYHKLILSLFTYSSLFFQCSLLELPPYLFTWSTFFRLCFSEDFSVFLCLKVFCIWLLSLENNFSELWIYIVRGYFWLKRGYIQGRIRGIACLESLKMLMVNYLYFTDDVNSDIFLFGLNLKGCSLLKL